ncbi:hypothetical protein [Roseovarius sp. MMSF_3281]|uniref:hypothetical protein n=1 Tax=Roseovarius sp. MMSF_3281 TaxID=3046694 RepID=UPI00273D8FC7|nr:hypothetical protein [Roseovarius sp. MMSF_3281]
MSTLEEHDAEQAEITAMCEAGTCDHPECHDDHFRNELVDRCAPRWAWDIIDETLAMDAESKAFGANLRADIKAAMRAMLLACERPDDQPISRKEADDAEV